MTSHLPANYREILVDDLRSFVHQGFLLRTVDASSDDCRRDDIEVHLGGQWELLSPSCLDWRAEIDAELARYVARHEHALAA